MPEFRKVCLVNEIPDGEGKTVEVDAIQPPEHALPVIEDALARYTQQRRRGFGKAH